MVSVPRSKKLRVGFFRLRLTTQQRNGIHDRRYKTRDTKCQHADRSVPYGRIAELIGTVQKGGLSRIGFVAEPGASAVRP